MSTKQRIKKLEQQTKSEKVVLTVVYDNGERGRSYVVTRDGLKPKVESEAQNDSGRTTI